MARKCCKKLNKYCKNKVFVKYEARNDSNNTAVPVCVYVLYLGWSASYHQDNSSPYLRGLKTLKPE